MRRAWLVGGLVSWGCCSGLVQAAPPVGRALEERVADGDLDAEDLTVRGAPRSVGGRATTYVGVAAFVRSSASSARDLGVLLVLGVPFDRAAARTPPGAELPETARQPRASTPAVASRALASGALPSRGTIAPDGALRNVTPPCLDGEGGCGPNPERARHRAIGSSSDVPCPPARAHASVGRPSVDVAATAAAPVTDAPVAPASAWSGTGPPRAPPPPNLVLAAAPRDPGFALTPSFARGVVAAAWRAAGLGDGVDALDATLARARLAAALPEARFRAVRSTDQSARVDALPDEHRTSDAIGANLYLEARLTWRLDRLLYGDDEPQLERLRSDRQDARARLAGRTVELLVRWQRAREDVRIAIPGTQEEREAELRALEATVGLDVLTGGAFARSVGN